MTGGLSTNFHGVGIGPLSNIVAIKCYLIPKYLCNPVFQLEEQFKVKFRVLFKMRPRKYCKS